MATLEQIEKALRAADAAGNVEDARRLAQAYKEARGQQKPRADFSGVKTSVSSTERITSAPGAVKVEQPAAPKRGNAVTRFLGEIGGRETMQGAYGLYGMLGGDALNQYVLSPLDRALFPAEQNLSGLITGKQPQQRHVFGIGNQTYRDAAAAQADEWGMRRPQTATQRVVADIGEGLTGTGLTMGVGGLLNLGRQAVQTAAPTVASRIGDFLTAQPVLQGVSTATGVGAGSIARESGAGEGAQAAASVLGALAPGGASYATGASLRGLARGRDGTQMQQTIDDFAKLGATPSVGQASDNRMVQGAENLLAGGPTSAGVMGRFAEKQADQIGRGLQQQGESLMRNASGERAGRAIERGIHGPDGFTARYKRTQEQLFDQLDNYIPSESRVDVSKTMGTLGQVNASIPGAPNVSKLFQNARVAGIGQALERDLAIPTPQQSSLDEALGKLDRLYSSRDAAVQDMGKFRAFANDQASRTNNWYPVEGLPRIAGRYSPFLQRAAEGMEAADEAAQAAMGNVSRAKAIENTLDELRAAAEATQGRLPYEAIKKLRTLVGQELQDAGLMSDFPRSKFKALYASLSSDLENAAREAGPEAFKAFQRANNYTRAGMSRVEMIERVIDKNGGPEKVFEAAMSGTRDGGTTLRAVMQSLPQDGQKAVTSAVIKRMGLAAPGVQDAAGDVFSAQTFLTNWNRVSPEAKRALFDRFGPQFSKDMDRVARVAQNIRDGSKVFANPSGTANRAAAMTYGASLVGSLFTGGTALLAGSGVGANLLARWMTNPATVRRLASVTALPKGSVPGAIQSMRRAGEMNDDADLIALADELENRERESR